MSFPPQGRQQSGGITTVNSGTTTVPLGDSVVINDVVPDDGGNYTAVVFPATGEAIQSSVNIPVFPNILDQDTGTIAQTEFVSGGLIWDDSAETWDLLIENEAGVDLGVNWAVYRMP